MARPVEAPRYPRQRRFRGLHALFAAGLMLLGGLGSAALVSLAAADGEYLALANDVDYAAPIDRADLVTVRLAPPPALQPVPASERERVVGSYAAARLTAGTLLTRQMLTSDPIPGPGQHVVGITVAADRLPAQHPRPGETVLLVSTADGQSATPAARTWTGTVIAVSSPQQGGLLQPGQSGPVTLDVVLPVAHGPAVAQAAAANQLVVVRAAGG